ncbi:hypothetical protein K437DRAFT_24758 [Tilletiaria anomala UBC 951]|uniref:Uncharacterized protein n=1 Tax=Tilletiaria anomala (strain ATCC 24038 / CBS 436.72 / UBC 951) TaxID=1037660 RepID=A0A066WI68_TILAU|nr:uncharacterized protein K437DRAFT_24758 [Tilletiaria anomala UBC 951]KDN52228.1 hypothetical protein K437DRAFT_24758 [Tilletiaria anomala UBC 951]
MTETMSVQTVDAWTRQSGGKVRWAQRPFATHVACDTLSVSREQAGTRMSPHRRFTRQRGRQGCSGTWGRHRHTRRIFRSNQSCLSKSHLATDSSALKFPASVGNISSLCTLFFYIQQYLVKKQLPASLVFIGLLSHVAAPNTRYTIDFCCFSHCSLAFVSHIHV